MAPPPAPGIDRVIDQSQSANSNQVQFGRDFLSFLLSARHTGHSTTASPYQLEVVWVYEQFRLIDAESYQRIYSRKNAKPLAKGFYIVSWPKGRGEQIFGDEAVFHGPYLRRKDAETSAEMFLTLLSRVEPDSRPRPTVRRITVKQDAVAQNWAERRNQGLIRNQPSRLY
jgi:hypothetical protein